MIAAEVGEWETDADDHRCNEQRVIEFTDHAWCVDERGPGWVELSIPVSFGTVYVRFDSKVFVAELRRYMGSF